MKRLVVFVIFGALVAGFLRTDFAHAATITIDTTNMTNQADGNGVLNECSLPDALAAANTNAAVDGCTAGDPATAAVDVVVIPSGTYDVSQMLNPTLVNLTESITIQGSGVGLTTISGAYISFEPISSVLMTATVHDLSMAGGSTIQAYTSSSSTMAANLDVHQLGLDGSDIYISQDGAQKLTATLSNIVGTNGSGLGMFNQAATNPGDTIVSNVRLDGGGSMGTAIRHMNSLANDRVYVKDSVITNYDTGILNAECTLGVVAIGSVYVTNSSIGGGNMRIGAENICGHLSVDSTTFQGISGAAILAQTNYMAKDGGFGTWTCHITQESSRIELTNNTFTAINVSSDSTAPAAIISLDSTLSPDCPSQSLTTDTTLLMQHNTFAGNTLDAFSDVAVMDGTALKGITMQNNAFEGNAVLGDFSVSGATAGINNVSTEVFAGPALLRSAFRQVGTFLLAPLVDNGGTAKIGYNQAGGHVLTFRPQWGSPLIDGASNVGIETDQRGQPRSLLRSYDVGSVEVTRGEVLGDGITVAALDAYLAAALPQLANTGVNVYLPIGIGVVMLAVGRVLWPRRTTRTVSF